MFRTFKIIILVTISSLSGRYLLFAQNFTQIDILKSRIDSLVNLGIDNAAYPGAVLYVLHKDSLILNNSYGYHTYEGLVPMNVNHIFDLASVTKVSAGVLAIMKLYDLGLIDLDVGIKKYISGFKWNERGKATLRATLTHQAGWRSWIPYYQDLKKDDGSWNRRFFRSDSSAKFPIKITDNLYLTHNNYRYIKAQIKRSDFNPEQGMIYSGLFSYLIPEMVLNLTKKPLDIFLKDNFYDALMSKTTGFNPLLRFPDSLIVPTEIDTFFRMEPIHGTVHDEGAIMMGGISGNAGLFSNAEDLAKIWSLFMHKGILNGDTLIRPETIGLFTSMQYPEMGNHRALGFDKPLIVYNGKISSVAEEVGAGSYGHTGYTGPIIWADPENELLFIFMCNRVYPNRTHTTLYSLGIRPKIQALVYDLIKCY
ncbi:MAG: serine hydrolase [Flammeovirgaceae bacterium]|jgi:serine-type D-Ala-D-Ala carboxypeptidase|nr:serine hydrolase [Flammeovirgaceae bacterium]|tara:strand:- start:15002 stop:16270 length:1269 start_codon:yes stop_codon:yes gene_type:complete